jgi:hypothetical protein
MQVPLNIVKCFAHLFYIFKCTWLIHEGITDIGRIGRENDALSSGIRAGFHSLEAVADRAPDVFLEGLKPRLPKEPSMMGSGKQSALYTHSVV